MQPIDNIRSVITYEEWKHLEEVQASLRAAKLTPNLSYPERMLLARDGLYRLHADGEKLRNVKTILYLE